MHQCHYCCFSFSVNRGKKIWQIFFFRCSNLYEFICGMCWIEIKTKYKISPIFIFWVMVIFWSFLWRHLPNFRCIFHDDSKTNIGEFFYVFFFILYSTFRIIHKNNLTDFLWNFHNKWNRQGKCHNFSAQNIIFGLNNLFFSNMFLTIPKHDNFCK